MSTNVKRSPLAQRLKKGLVEGIEFVRDDLNIATTVVPSGRTFSGDEVVAIRNRRHMSQAQFANLLAVNVKTLQSWEQGARPAPDNLQSEAQANLAHQSLSPSVAPDR